MECPRVRRRVECRDGVGNSRSSEKSCSSYQHDATRHTSSSRKYFTLLCSVGTIYAKLQVTSDVAGIDVVPVFISNEETQGDGRKRGCTKPRVCLSAMLTNSDSGVHGT